MAVTYIHTCQCTHLSTLSYYCMAITLSLAFQPCRTDSLKDSQSVQFVAIFNRNSPREVKVFNDITEAHCYVMTTGK